VYKAEQAAEQDAKLGKRVEVWVTVLGELHTQARGSPCGASGYGHLGAYPAELVVKSFSDIKVVANPAHHPTMAACTMEPCSWGQATRHLGLQPPRTTVSKTAVEIRSATLE